MLIYTMLIYTTTFHEYRSSPAPKEMKMATTVSSRPTLLVLFCLSYFMLSIYAQHACALSFNLSFADPRSPNLATLINCTGDAFIASDSLELTKDRRLENITHSTGRAQYTQKVPLWDRTTGEMASFTTTFSFQITLDPSTYPGDGLAFFLGDPRSGIPPNSDGGSMGLSTNLRNGTGAGRIVAAEFDTFLNPQNADTSGNHIGIDVNSVNSTASQNITSPSNNLRSNSTMVATVRYENATMLMVVDLRINSSAYNVNATVDLRSYLPEDVLVGFSAATGVGGEQHQILSWSFSSTLEPKTAVLEPAPPPLSIVDPITSKHGKKVGTTLIAVIVPLLVLVACAAMGLLVWRRHKRKSNEASYDSDDHEQDYRAELERGVAASGPRRYTYRELAAATSDFAEDAKLGRGGFGSVYLGNLADRPVAIKVFSSESSAQGRKEFEAEVRIISRLKHRNLVQLLGWCDSGNGLLLVYELVAQGSLDKHLYSRDRLLTWQERYQIILGLGSALRYLHQEWEQCVVHGDIKPSNIMLDESLGAKLGDFGLARLSDHGGGGWHTTKAVMGTAGYIDPEFVNTGRPSTRSDVYSFGIVLLELACGRPPVILKEGDEPPFLLLRWVWSLYGKNAALDAVDERLMRGDDDDDDDEQRVEMERVLVVGLWCAHPDSGERPSIAQAMHVLQSEDARLPTLQPQMYRSVSDLAVTGRAYGSLSIESHTGDSKPSSDSSSTALLQRS